MDIFVVWPKHKRVYNFEFCLTQYQNLKDKKEEPARIIKVYGEFKKTFLEKWDYERRAHQFCLSKIFYLSN